MKREKITAHFSLSEFEQSDTAIRKGIDNSITDLCVKAAVTELVTTILEPLRVAWGKHLTISSGYRSKALNEAIHGSKTSAHLTGYAADIQVDADSNQDEFNAFAVHFLVSEGIKFDQLINESRGETKWLHIGMYNNAHKQRGQVFIINQ